ADAELVRSGSDQHAAAARARHRAPRRAHGREHHRLAPRQALRQPGEQRLVQGRYFAGARSRRSPASIGAGVAGARTHWMARRTASGVLGAASGTSRTRPGAANAATASRIASRAESASISGGSPTALLP